jgi:hypothetical protein
MKTVLLVILALMTGQICYGQVHDESFRTGEPVKFVEVYPNPAIDFLTIKFENPIAKTSKLAFHSIIGNSIELEQEVVDEFEIRVKVKELPIGYYIIMVNDPISSERGIYKFLKK